MRRLAAALLLCALAITASAHHSTRAFYDRGSTVEVEGTVTGVFWKNPHVMVRVDVEDAEGNIEEWDLEGGAMNSLLRRGFTGESVSIGDRVRVAGGPSVRGRNALFLTNFLLPSGEEVLFTDRDAPLLWTQPASAGGGRAAPIEAPGTGIFKVWSGSGARYTLRDPLQLTPAAEAAQAGWDARVDDPSLRCQAPGMPNAVLNPYPIELIDEGERILFNIEEWDGRRVIHMNADAGSQNPPPSLLGYSVGRWEGETLVVETTRIDAPFLDDSGTPMSGNVEMAERITPSADGRRLDYEIVITDPENLIQPAIWDQTRFWEPGADVKPFECTLQDSIGRVYE